MISSKSQPLSRREFLKTAAMVGAGAALAACAPAGTAPAASSGAPAVNTGAKQTVRYLSW